MVPADFKDFLIACIGASASFIGLLFVGLSVVMQKSDQKLADTDRILAESSYASLINIFFVSLIGILPDASISIVCVVMACIGLINCFRLRHYSRAVSLTASLLVYLLELGFGIELIVRSNQYINEGVFETIFIFLFSMGLVRAWNLTGIHNNKKQ